MDKVKFTENVIFRAVPGQVFVFAYLDPEETKKMTGNIKVLRTEELWCPDCGGQPDLKKKRLQLFRVNGSRSADLVPCKDCGKFFAANLWVQVRIEIIDLHMEKEYLGRGIEQDFVEALKDHCSRLVANMTETSDDLQAVCKLAGMEVKEKEGILEWKRKPKEVVFEDPK